MSDIERVNEIERLIAEGRLNAAQVFTQMKQLLPAAKAPASGEVEPVAFRAGSEDGVHFAGTKEGAIEEALAYGLEVIDVEPLYTYPPAKVPAKIEIDKFDATKKKIWERGWNAAIDAMLTTPTPATTTGAEWVKCEYRLPELGEVVIAKYEGVYAYRLVHFWKDYALTPHFGLPNEPDGKGSQPATHWKLTGLKRLTPPQEQ